MHKDIRKLVREIEARGYVCEQGRSHILVRNSDGKGMVASLPLTPGRGRWELNLRSQLRKAGVLD